MMPAVRASGLAVSSASIAQICPAYGDPSRLGQWISASGTWTPLAGPLAAARMRRSLRHHACPSWYTSPPSSHSRTASTARMCARRPSDGRVAG